MTSLGQSHAILT